MEPEWQKTQKRTFTRWINSYIRVRQQEVVHLYEDLSSGWRLAALVEMLCSVRLAYRTAVRNRFDMLANVQAALTHLVEQEGLVLVGIGAEDVVDQKATLVLGLVWTIILRLQIRHQGGGPDALLQWVQSHVPETKNLASDLKDGRRLGALLMAIKPGLVLQLGSDPVDNCRRCLEAAEQHMGIPQLLDARDLAEVADDKSNRVYISLLRQWAESEREPEKVVEMRAPMVFQMQEQAEAPTEAVWCCITGKDHRYVAHISEGGELISAYGELLGYLNLDGLQVASAQENFLACMESDMLTDADDELLGEINRGQGSFQQPEGNTVFSMDNAGHLKGNSEVYLGTFEGLGFRDIDVIALCTVLMPDFFREDTR